MSSRHRCFAFTLHIHIGTQRHKESPTSLALTLEIREDRIYPVNFSFCIDIVATFIIWVWKLNTYEVSLLQLKVNDYRMKLYSTLCSFSQYISAAIAYVWCIGRYNIKVYCPIEGIRHYECTLYRIGGVTDSRFLLLQLCSCATYIPTLMTISLFEVQVHI